MKTRRYVQMMAVMIMGLFIFSSCGGPGKMANHPEKVTYKVTPEVLEAIGGKVNFTADATVAPNYFAKKAVVVLFPEVKDNAGSELLDPMIVVGEKGSSLGYPVISKKNGGSASYKGSFNYKPEMEVSELNVKMFVLSIKEFKKIANPKSYNDYLALKNPDYTEKLADGVIITSTRIKDNEQVALMAHGYEKITKVSKSASYYFSIGSSVYSASFGANKNDATKKSINDVKDFIKLGWKIDNITVDGWASPDGEIRNNNQLSDHRATTVKKIWEKDKVFGKTPPSIISKGNGEDWEGYTSSVQNSSFPDKAAAMAVVTNYNSNDKEGRQRAINELTRKHPAMNATILDPLRRAIITVTCLEPKFTDAELADYAISNPSKLKEPEILYAATLYPNDLDKQLAVYKNAMQQFPQSAKAFNNAAAIALLKMDNSDATQWLKQAESMNGSALEIENNMGVLYARQGELDNAANYFNKAKSLPAAQYNLGLINIAKGDFTQAQGLLSNDKCTYGLALAQLETKNIDGAISNLNCCENKTADVYYLSAVAYARKGDKANMATNLKSAIAANPKLKAVAQKDREFIKFFNDASFLDAIK